MKALRDGSTNTDQKQHWCTALPFLMVSKIYMDGSSGTFAEEESKIMGYNYAKEQAKMEYAYQKFEREYTEAYETECREGKIHKTDLGKALSEIYDFENECLNSERRYRIHTLSYHEIGFNDNDASSEEHSPLIKDNLEYFSNKEHEIWEWGRYSWINDIDDPELYSIIKSLSQQNIEMLTLKIIDGKTQTEISKIFGVSSAAISKRMKGIRKKFLDFYKKG